MSKTRNRNAKYLRFLIRNLNDDVKSMADKIIKAYLEGSISQISTAENVLFKLISNDKRVYKSGVKLYDKVMENMVIKNLYEKD